MGLPSLDVFFALITVYIVLALTVSAFTEVITRLVGLRSIGLKAGIRSILQDPNLKALAVETKKFWDSGIIKSVTNGDSSPNSLDAMTFATATLSTIGSNIPRDASKAKAVIEDAPLNAHLKEVLDGLAERAISRGTSLHDELAQHFDATMEKVARWYRHWTHGIALLLAVAITLSLNANSLDLLHQLTAHPEARLELARLQSTLSADNTANALKNANAAEAIITKDTLGGSVAWPKEWSERFRLVLGLLITTLAVSLGAPFWFDVLGRINPKNADAARPPSSVSTQPVPVSPRTPDAK